LDTRTKILTAEEARQRLDQQPVCWVSGHFDPLLAEHVRRLKSFATGGKLLVVEVTNPLQPLLAQQARAELVAALAVVDHVVLSDRPPSNDSSADAAITEKFILHVLSRHRKEVRE
jgi:bifunctional ADP-heptose synthase (sugar kinase/adenylyltransferase)